MVTCCLLCTACVVPGAGAFEIAAHDALMKHKVTVKGRARLGKNSVWLYIIIEKVYIEVNHSLKSKLVSQQTCVVQEMWHASSPKFCLLLVLSNNFSYTQYFVLSYSAGVVLTSLLNQVSHWDYLSLWICTRLMWVLAGKLTWSPFPGLILGLHPANERRRYLVTPSLIGWVQTWDQPCFHPCLFSLCAETPQMSRLAQNRHKSTVNTLRPRQNDRHLPDDIFKCFFWMKMFEYWLRFHWSLFLRVQLAIIQHWFR